MTSVQEAIILSSNDESEEEIFSALADERPPSDEDYESSITLSSGEDSESEEDDVTEDKIEDEKDDVTEDKIEDEKTQENGESSTTTKNGEDKTTKVKKPTKARKRKSPNKKPRSKSKSRRKKVFERRNIRKIITDAKLDENTVNAQKEEEERKKRLAVRGHVPDAPHLKSLLLESGGDTPARTNTNSHDVVELLSSDDDCMIVDAEDPLSSEEEEEEEESDDPENSGIHVDDSKNQPDQEGRVLVNVAHPPGDPDLFLSPQLAKMVKPHQIGGIRFLYDNLVESLQRFKLSSGFGCILAHSMGLGKTCQIVAFTDVIMRVTEARRVLIIVPINTLQNWINEFDMWLPAPENLAQGVGSDEMTPRTFKLLIINDTHKSIDSRAKVIEQWTRDGGVLLMGYEMFRLLATRKTKAKKRKANAGPELIDIDLEEKTSGLQMNMQQALLDPGPDLVICDEGHRIKNSLAGISKSLKQIHTKRRVVLTGYPLQNNLIEYWCMVDFVRPNFLGNKTEFSNMFERPISNGQCADSTPQDMKLMKYRAHVLHNLLEGFVQRRNHNVLMKNLPPKQEWVLMVKMSEFQRKIYNMFMDNLSLEGESCIGGTNPLKAFAVACKIWNHPDVMHNYLDRHTDQDFELDVGLPANGSLTNGKPAKKMRKSASESALSLKATSRDSPLSSLFGISERTAEITYDWVKPAFESYPVGILENSGKFLLLFHIIEETLFLNEKLLVFSQSLMTLNLLEEFLSKTRVPIPGGDETWVKNYSYYRLDGSTNASEREKLIKQFNSIDNKDTHLFLLSTKAGCLGINLVGANRVVMLDASWNPCHDCQAVCRVYRYGQYRPCFIYRFVTDNTMERKIYDRQISKQGMADRVVDEIQVNNQFSKKENDQLLEYQDRQLPTINPDGIDEKGCFDPVLVKLIKEHHGWITQDPFIHESLLIEAEDQRLTRTEKRLAKEGYEREKKFSVSFGRQSYANYYQNKTPPPPPPPPVFRGPTLPPINRPIMSRPAVSTPQMGAPSIPFNHPNVCTRPRMIRPDVSVQTISAHKDISLPGEGSRVINKGELLTIIRTSNKMYIKLRDGKLFAVKSRKDAEDFGIPEDASQCPAADSGGPDQMLSSLLQSGTTRQIAPNIVSRKPLDNRPNIHSQGTTYPHNTQPSDTMSPPTYSTYPNSPMNSGFPTYNNMPTTSNNPMSTQDNSFALTENNFFQHMAGGSYPNTNTAAAMPSYNMPSPYPSGGYQSQYDQFPSFRWGSPLTSSGNPPPDPLNVNGTMSTSLRQPSQPTHQPHLHDSASLPNLNHLSRMPTPLMLPALDQTDPQNQHGYDSETSLPSLDGNGPL